METFTVRDDLKFSGTIQSVVIIGTISVIFILTCSLCVCVHTQILSESGAVLGKALVWSGVFEKQEELSLLPFFIDFSLGWVWQKPRAKKLKGVEEKQRNNSLSGYTESKVSAFHSHPDEGFSLNCTATGCSLTADFCPLCWKVF